ncbi:MAG: hypothetical protein ACRDA9_14940, partial [Plesiomonas shigelloides]
MSIQILCTNELSFNYTTIIEMINQTAPHCKKGKREKGKGKKNLAMQSAWRGGIRQHDGELLAGLAVLRCAVSLFAELPAMRNRSAPPDTARRQRL